MVVEFLQRKGRALAVGGRRQTVLFFQNLTDLVRPPPLIIMGDLPALAVYAGGYYMYMLTVYILMQKDNIGLLTVTHPLHIVGGEVGVLLSGQHIVRVWIERYMDDGVARIAVGVEVWLKVGQSLGHISFVPAGGHFIGEKYLSGLDLLLIGVIF